MHYYFQQTKFINQKQYFRILIYIHQIGKKTIFLRI